MRHLVKHKSVKYTCNECRKVFSTPSSHKDHQLFHKDSLYKCNCCDEHFVYPCGLNLHHNLHRRNRTYACWATDYDHKYKWLQDLLRHMKLHLKEKLYQCLICNYKTYEGRLYKRHVIVHTNKKPYKCHIMYNSIHIMYIVYYVHRV